MRKDQISTAAPRPATFNPDKYRHHLARFNMAIERESELIEAVARIMASFVDRGFGHDPAQLRGAGDRFEVVDEAGRLPVIELEPTPIDDRELAEAFREADAAGQRKR